jgi:hypothetical protein
MSHLEFSELLSSLSGPSPEQLATLRREVDSQMASSPPSGATQTAAVEQPQTKHKPIWELIEEENRSVPTEVWDGLPPDLSEQHDHYVYGTPKHLVE